MLMSCWLEIHQFKCHIDCNSWNALQLSNNSKPFVGQPRILILLVHDTSLVYTLKTHLSTMCVLVHLTLSYTINSTIKRMLFMGWSGWWSMWARRSLIMSSIPLTNTFSVETVAQGLPSTIYLADVVCRLLRQPKGLSSAHTKRSGCWFPR